MKIRDELDLNGGNFIKPQDAIEVNVSNITIEEVYDLIMSYINNIDKKS